MQLLLACNKLNLFRTEKYLCFSVLALQLQTLINASKEAGLEVNTEKTKYLLLSRHQNAGQNHDIKIANRSFENAAQFKYFGTTTSNQNLIQEEIKRSLNSGNACYHSVQSLLSSPLLTKT
jgi:hypothetical protein